MTGRRGKWADAERCGVIGKVCFPSKRAAREALPNNRHCTVFRCGWCAQYHFGRPRGRGGGRR